MACKMICLIFVIPVAFFIMPADSKNLRPSNSFSCTEKGLFPHPISTECKLYYECDDDLNARLGDCVAELRPQSNWLPVHYSRSLKKCEFGGCPFEYLTTTTTTTTTSTTTTTTTEPPTTTTTTTTESPTTTTPEFSCTSDGYFPDPRSCTKFHVCVLTDSNAYDYEFSCPTSTVYCPQFQVCGWERDCPCNVP